MNVKAWLDIYDDTQYRDGNWNVDIVAKTFRTLLADIDTLYEDREVLVRYVRAVTYYANEQIDIFALHDDDAKKEYDSAYEELSQELKDKIT